MKRLWLFLLPCLAVAGLAHVASLALPGNQPTASAGAAGEPQPPAPYPPGFRRELGRLAGMEIRLHWADETPVGIPWTDGGAFAEIGDPAARKGGVMRLSNVGPYPANLLAFGSPAPQFFHYNLFDMVEIPLVREHPSTGQEMPGLASAWAVCGNTVYFKLNPAATYSNGRPVRAGDFALGALLRCKAGGDGSWERLRHAARGLHAYGDGVLALVMRRPGPAMALQAAQLLRPAEPGFYAEFGADYATRYAWRVPPTTGGYTAGKIERGRMLSLERVRNWWAKDLPGFRYTCNADTIEHHFLTDEAQAWEFLLRGKLDALQTRNIPAWQRYMEAGGGADGHGSLVPYRFALDCPMPPYGIAINARALPDIELRRGLMHALDMTHATAILFCGEAERLTAFTTGYKRLPHSVPACPYDPAAARECFKRAGYTEQGADGILRKPGGARLSIAFTYVPSAKNNTLATILAQSAAACGAEIVPEAVPWQICDKKVREGSHQLVFWATVAQKPLPNHREWLHSGATASPFRLQSAEMDAALDACDNATDQDSCAKAFARLDQLVYEAAIWLPGWKENQVRLAAWRHVHFPANMDGEYDVVENHTYWIAPPLR